VEVTEELKKRAFLVGCARSGTTLLVSLLGAHPAVKSFPESHFFVGLIGQAEARTLPASEVPIRRKVGRLATDLRVRLGRANREGVRARLHEFLEKANHLELFGTFPLDDPSAQVQVDAFIGLLDNLTKADDKQFWVEKTPQHLYYIDAIECYVKPVKFIHIVRSGPDVVASLYDAARKYDTVWRYYQDSVDRCINAWNKSIPVTLKNMKRPGHIAIAYEQLVDDPDLVLRRLCEFLEIEQDDGLVERYSNVARFVSAGEPWKASVHKGIVNANTKFGELFTPEQQAYIKERLLDVDPKTFYLK